MREKMLAKFSNSFLFLAVGFLMLFNSFAIEAQDTSARCEKGYVYDQVYDQVYEPEQEPWYNTANGAWQTRTVWKYKWRWVWKCVPIPLRANSTTSKDKKNNSSDSNKVGKTKTKPGLSRPYSGEYSGKWITTYSDSVEQKGEWKLRIDIFGNIRGEELNTTFNVKADISGSVSEDGNIELIIQYTGRFSDSPPSIVKGSISNAENRRLKGTLNQYDKGKITSVIKIDLAPKN
ncbi:MAG TPA: hypothetical protein VF721_21555 [Pyrinomonadaceae bacterium]